MPASCLQCGARSRNMTEHVRVEHQNEVEIRYLGQPMLPLLCFSLIFAHIGSSVLITRQSDGFFHCPCGTFSHRNPDCVKRHVKSACSSGVEPVLGPENPSDDESDTAGLPAPRTPTLSGSLVDLRPSANEDGNNVDQGLNFSLVNEAARQPSPFPPLELQDTPDPPSFAPFPSPGQHASNDSAQSSAHPSISPARVADHVATLSRCGIMVNLTHRLLICADCSEAVYPPHTRTHVTDHGTPCPSTEQLTALLEELDVASGPTLDPSEVFPPVLGLSIYDGLKCTVAACHLSFYSKRSFERHCQEQHVGFPRSSIPCKVHRIFKNRALQLVIRIDPDLSIQHPHGTFAQYLSCVHSKDEPSPDSINPSVDPRRLNAFLYSVRWHDVVRGLPLDAIQLLVSLPRASDPLFPVLQEILSMFQHMCNVVDDMDVLTRRHILTPKGYVRCHS